MPFESGTRISAISGLESKGRLMRELTFTEDRISKLSNYIALGIWGIACIPIYFLDQLQLDPDWLDEVWHDLIHIVAFFWILLLMPIRDVVLNWLSRRGTDPDSISETD